MHIFVESGCCIVFIYIRSYKLAILNICLLLWDINLGRVSHQIVEFCNIILATLTAANINIEPHITKFITHLEVMPYPLVYSVLEPFGLYNLNYTCFRFLRMC